MAGKFSSVPPAELALQDLQVRFLRVFPQMKIIKKLTSLRLFF